jgi:hypothetical protein
MAPLPAVTRGVVSGRYSPTRQTDAGAGKPAHQPAVGGPWFRAECMFEDRDVTPDHLRFHSDISKSIEVT